MHRTCTIALKYINFVCKDCNISISERKQNWTPPRKKFKSKNKLMIMVFNATFNTISVISWRSVSLVEETGIPGENHRPVASHWQTLSHNVVSSTPRLNGFQTHRVSSGRHDGINPSTIKTTLKTNPTI